MGSGAKRYAAKRDANEPRLVRVARMLGATVWHLSDKGIPDLLVGYCGRNILVEVKSPGGKLTDAQSDKFAKWAGDPVHIWRDHLDVVATLDGDGLGPPKKTG